MADVGSMLHDRGCKGVWRNSGIGTPLRFNRFFRQHTQQLWRDFGGGCGDGRVTRATGPFRGQAVSRCRLCRLKSRSASDFIPLFSPVRRPTDRQRAVDAHYIRTLPAQDRCGINRMSGKLPCAVRLRHA